VAKYETARNAFLAVPHSLDHRPVRATLEPVVAG